MINHTYSIILKGANRQISILNYKQFFKFTQFYVLIEYKLISPVFCAAAKVISHNLAFPINHE